MLIVIIKNVLLVILIALLVLVLRALSVFLVMMDFSLKLTLVEHLVLQVFGKMNQPGKKNYIKKKIKNLKIYYFIFFRE
jgi:hypothetical protein